MRYSTLLILIILTDKSNSYGYSLLTHEAIVDAIWNVNIVPLLKSKYPDATLLQMQEAHAYAYGGAVAPDMGYYPLGSRFFTNLTHYVRSGDLVMAMFEEATTINEYAFAIGWLTHYYADNYGHSIGINQSVPIIFPKLKDRYGDTVTYNDDHTAHIRTELSFDVVQVARGNYNSDAYLEYIGFKVSDTVLRKAFAKTYGLKIDEVYPDYRRAVSTFRWIVKEVFPQLTRTAWEAKKNEILKSTPTATRRSYVYRMRSTDYLNEFGSERANVNLSAKLVVLLIRFLPKVGPMKKLKPVIPSAEAEKLFVQSFDTVVVRCANSLSNLDAILANKNFDTGELVVAGKYDIADNAYIDLLLKLRRNNFDGVSSVLESHLISICTGLKRHLAAQHHTKKLKEVTSALNQLKARGSRR